MPRDVTTNLRFPESLYRDLQYAAERRGVSMAAVVREAVSSYLGRADDTQAIAIGEDPADRLIGSVAFGPDDESVNHDRYLYGWPADASNEATRRHRGTARSRPEERPSPPDGGQVLAKRAPRQVRSDRSSTRGSGDPPASSRRSRKSGRDRS
jgi:hypothetical protein